MILFFFIGILLFLIIAKNLQHKQVLSSLNISFSSAENEHKKTQRKKQSITIYITNTGTKYHRKMWGVLLCTSPHCGKVEKPRLLLLPKLYQIFG